MSAAPFKKLPLFQKLLNCSGRDNQPVLCKQSQPLWRFFICVLVVFSAVVGPDVRCGSCGGERRARAEPQSGDRSEAAELHHAAHLAARDQPHELPTHGKHSCCVSQRLQLKIIQFITLFMMIFSPLPLSLS